MKFFDTIRSTSSFPKLDPTTPWYSYILYQNCCWSLDIPDSVGKWTRYNNYYRQDFKES